MKTKNSSSKSEDKRGSHSSSTKSRGSNASHMERDSHGRFKSSK